jgi:hypothetical protein
MWLGEGVMVPAQADADHCCLRLLVAAACDAARRIRNENNLSFQHSGHALPLL